MSSMPKWLIPIIVGAWVGGGVAAYYGYWIPVLVLVALGILAATSAAGMLWANRGAVKVVSDTVAKAAGPAPKETAAEAAARRREETKRRQERNRKHRRTK
ncbi:MAG: hypothetical protein AAF721_03705 [Myxococcota bacterium]